MKFLDFFKPPKRSAALVAKERLQIIVSHESSRNSKDFIKDLQRELLEVIGKYVNIDPEQIKVQLEQHGDQSVLELNVTLPEFVTKKGVQTTQAPKVPKPKAEKTEKVEKSQSPESLEQSEEPKNAEVCEAKSSEKV